MTTPPGARRWTISDNMRAALMPAIGLLRGFWMTSTQRSVTSLQSNWMNGFVLGRNRLYWNRLEANSSTMSLTFLISGLVSVFQ